MCKLLPKDVSNASAMNTLIRPLWNIISGKLTIPLARQISMVLHYGTRRSSIFGRSVKQHNL